MQVTFNNESQATYFLNTVLSNDRKATMTMFSVSARGLVFRFMVTFQSRKIIAINNKFHKVNCSLKESGIVIPEILVA